MPYLKEHNLLFIHIPKTGGTSIEKAFGIYHKWDYEKLIHTKQEKINGITTAPQHWTPELIKNKIGNEVYSKCIKFSIVRNPYNRVLSEFFYVTKKSSLDGFEEWFFEYYLNIDNDHKIPQSLFIDDSIDYLARTESLQEDFTHFVKLYNINIDPKLEYINRSRVNTNELVKHLSKKVVNRINYLYEEDFNLFDYKFL